MIDWDDVRIYPLPLTELTFNHRIQDFSDGNWVFSNSTQDALYDAAISHLVEQKPCASPRIGQRLEENDFLQTALGNFRGGVAGLPEYADAQYIFNRTAENLAQAKNEWIRFADIYFHRQNRPIPYWNWCVELQESLGLVGNSTFARAGRWLQRETDAWWEKVFTTLSQKFPGSRWIQEKHCYFTAAFSEDYKLPGGLIAC